MKLRKNKKAMIGTFGALALAAALWIVPTRMAAAEDRILAVLLENGDLPLPAGQTMTFPLFCEGDTQCGTVEYKIIELRRFDAGVMDMVMDTKVCKGVGGSASCVTAGRARFIGDALPLPQPKGIAYATHMVEHDPIQCSQVSGDFLVPGCTGKLQLDYRCLTVADPEAKILLKAFASSYIVSEKN